MSDLRKLNRRTHIIKLANENHSYYHTGMNHLIPVKTLPLPLNAVVRAQDLLGANSVLVIENAGERYLLRLTKNGKLILTK